MHVRTALKALFGKLPEPADAGSQAILHEAQDTLALARDALQSIQTAVPVREVRPLNAVLEWQRADDLSKHFDELLMKMRSFGLPFVTGAIVAGAGAITKIPRIEVSTWLLVAICAACAVLSLVLCVIVSTEHDKNWQKLAASMPFLGLGGCFVFWAYLIHNNEPGSFSLAGPVLIFGALVLTLLYLLDRYYYTNMLVGVSDRATELEDTFFNHITTKSKELTKDERDNKEGLNWAIVKAVGPWTFKFAPLLLYFVPILIMVNSGLAVVAYGSHNKECKVSISLEADKSELHFALDADHGSDLSGCPLSNLSNMRLLPGNR